MKIAIVSVMEGYPWGGSEELWYQMAKEALKQGHQLFISYKKWEDTPPKLKELEQKGANIYFRENTVRYPSLIKRALYKLLDKKAQIKHEDSFKWLDNIQPNIILVNEGGFLNAVLFPTLTDRLMKGAWNYFTLTHSNREYGAVGAEKRKLGRELYSKAKSALFVSEGNKKMAEIFLCNKLPNTKIVRNPVNLNALDYIPYPEDKTMRLAIVGRLLCRQKGHDLLLRALAELKNEYSFSLAIYGQGPDADYLKTLVKYLHLQDIVHFEGHVRNIEHIWSKNQLLILPSHFEGMPLVVVEAMLSGRPCLVTDVAGYKEWVNDNSNGFICTSNKVIALTRCLRFAFDAQKTWKKMGLQARKDALNISPKDPGRKLLKAIMS